MHLVAKHPIPTTQQQQCKCGMQQKEAHPTGHNNLSGHICMEKLHYGVAVKS